MDALALTQEVAYHSVLLERRQGLHERTAQAIEKLYRHGLEDHYGELAHHYGRSGNAEKAVKYLGLAGRQALERSAYGEAIRQLTAALELIKTLSDSPERIRQELFLQTTLGLALMAIQGWGSSEVELAYSRARELCRQVGEAPQLFPVLWGLSMFHLVRAEHRMALEMGEQLLSLAQEAQDAALLIGAHYAVGAPLLLLGETAPAGEHFERGIALYDPRQHGLLASLYGLNLSVICLVYAAASLWLLGSPDQVLKRIEEAITLAQEVSHPYSLAFALICAPLIHSCHREAQAAQERAAAGIALAEEQGFSFYLSFVTIWHGWALAEQGEVEDGIAQMHQGLDTYRATGAVFLQTWFFALLAEAYGKAGQIEEGLTALAEALALAQKAGERVYEAELYRLQGELLLKSTTQGPASRGERFSKAEACFHQALDIARRQGARSLDPGSSPGLSRLWQGQGKREEARQRLAEIYGWFTEGFDTADLKEARALLEELS